MKYLNLIFGTVLGWFENPGFTFVFALLLSAVAFFGADPVAGVPTANVAVLALLVGVLTTAVLLTGTSIVTKQEYDFVSLGCAVFGSIAGTLAALTVTLFV